MLKYKNYLLNLILPALFYGSITGAAVGVIISLYKFCAGHAVSLSGEIYTFLRGNAIFFIPAICVSAVIAFAMAVLYKKLPNARGGGIPTSIGILRGKIPFEWLQNLIAAFFASLVSFLVGVPLGTEGPSVQIGTTIGRGVSRAGARKHAAWDRYILTGGACAGFATATGAPISGILFAIEEAHQRISPMVFAVSAVAVTVAKVVSDALSPLLSVESHLFAPMQLVTLTGKELWLPILIGIVVGLCSVVFLKYYRTLHGFWSQKLAKLPSFAKIWIVLLLTVALGAVSYSFVSTGHGLIDTLLHGGGMWYLLLAALFVRSTLMILASSSGITGGLFLPILALGALISALIGKGAVAVLGLPEEYYSVIVVLGICASIAGMMKTPIIAMVFSIEALSAADNVLPVIITTAIAFFITEIFYVDSINEHVLENRIADIHKGKTATAFDAYVTVQGDSFAVGKQIRDILWPSDLLVLSLTRAAKRDSVVDAYGEKVLHPGDTLHVRYLTYDHDVTKAELIAIVGEQAYDENRVEKM